MTVVVTLIGGWADGRYETAFPAAPERLIAVTGPNGTQVLDLDDDEPEEGEVVHEYDRVGFGHVCGCDGPEGGCRPIALYAPVRGGTDESMRRLVADFGAGIVREGIDQDAWGGL